MKKCCNCGLYLPLDCFNSNKSKPDKLGTECKVCSKIFSKKYREKNKDEIKVKKHIYYENNKDATIKRVNSYIENNREQYRIYGKISRIRIKKEVFSHYCGSDNICCKFCGETELCVLSIDHIDGNGAEHRRKLGKSRNYGGSRFYFWIKKNNFPEGFQVLCMNCQYKKRMQEMKPENPTEKQIKIACKVQELKLECLQHYGEICQCGETDQVVLTLDHVNDDGSKHRKELGVRGYGFYIYLRKNNFPNDPPLQVLCVNCQFRKRAKIEEEINNNNLKAVAEKAIKEITNGSANH
jgi:hypothetical protein